MYSHFWYLWKINIETEVKLHISKGKLSRKLFWFRLDPSPMTISYTLTGLSSPPQLPNHPRGDMWNTMPFLSPEDRLTLHSLPLSVRKVKPALVLKIKEGTWKQYILMVWCLKKCFRHKCFCDIFYLSDQAQTKQGSWQQGDVEWLSLFLVLILEPKGKVSK